MAKEAGGQVEKTLSVIANRFVGLNPKSPLTYRAYSDRGIRRSTDYRYDADFDRIFPNAKDEQCVHAWSRMWSPRKAGLMFDINCRGPLIVFCNGEEVWRSDIFSERYPDRRNRVTLNLQEGWNYFVIQARKTRGGFGWRFGSWLGKHPYVFMMPSPEREGREGWLFTDPLPKTTAVMPEPGQKESETGLAWHPGRDWDPSDQSRGQLERILGLPTGKTAVAWTRLTNARQETLEVPLRGSHSGKIRLLLDGNCVHEAEADGSIDTSISLEPGSHDLMIHSTCSGEGWGFRLSAYNGVRLEPPCSIKGSSAEWLFAGPFEPDSIPSPEVLGDFCQPHQTVNGLSYWRLDEPETWLRLYNENPLFGRWNYPLGVTIYGLLHAGKAIGSEAIQQYVADHVQVCCSTFPYALWDRSQFGGPTHVHRLLSSIDSLDDCGSFGSCMLEVAKYNDLQGVRPIADFVADFITEKQDRFSDGAFYRREMMHEFHENTMWADDLYMSVPFLCRYYQITREDRYIDDAANQFLGFRKRLYMPEQKLMSHVYDLRREMATGVPWGRGNGWTLFSLSELLAVLPGDHSLREELTGFFRELCSGILPLQDREGMWHQVLTHPDAYPETSCTAMFIYAFSRGVQFGWLENTAPYIQAVRKGWEALNRISIDHEGNVYGVCRGSEFSFSPDYYKFDLLWNLNDTHGIGITLLAGVEVKKLQVHLESQQDKVES